MHVSRSSISGLSLSWKLLQFRRKCDFTDKAHQKPKKDTDNGIPALKLSSIGLRSGEYAGINMRRQPGYHKHTVGRAKVDVIPAALTASESALLL
jgi:hypothetical protein